MPPRYARFSRKGKTVKSKDGDGGGTVQALEVKLISLAVWALFYIGLLAIEWLVYAIARRSRR